MHTHANAFPASNTLTLIVRWAIVLALTVLLISMATGQSGISNYMKLLEMKEELSDINSSLLFQNQSLEEKTALLKTSPEAQVRFLKENFGYVEKGEFLYRFDKNILREIQSKKIPKEARNEIKKSNRG